MMFHSQRYVKYVLFTIILYALIPETKAQNSFSDKNILTAYYKYTGLPREIAYVHLNKSKYIKGENIGFTAYIIDKKNGTLSKRTSNLYCVISDTNEKVIKEKLIKVEDGMATDAFRLDSLFTSGEYQFKAYTNWMNNFDEHNFYLEKIDVIDPEVQEFIKPTTLKTNVDAQFLPEGGHLISDIRNTVGVIVKDDLGFGFPFIDGDVFDSNDSLITSFKLNRLGIGKFDFIPKKHQTYKVNLNILNSNKIYPIEPAENIGINMSIHRLRNNLAMTIRTNEATHQQIKNERYRIVVHNGINIKDYQISFKDKTEINTFIKQSDLYSGMNIITVFDGKNNPILERLFFNYGGINIHKSQNISQKKEQDSIHISLNFTHLKSNDYNTLSISVLPAETLSYDHQQNIISSTLLQPYLNSPIEDASYYFTDIDTYKKEALDQLLLTQGWSSYHWNTIFNNPPEYIYDFETGISVKANLNSKSSPQFYFYALEDSNSFITNVDEGDHSFKVESLFPYEDEYLRISNVNSDGKFEIPKLYLQFTPSKIPELNIKRDVLGHKQLTSLSEKDKTYVINTFSDDYEQLDEVLLTYDHKGTQIEKLQSMAFGDVEIFNDNMRHLYRDFFSYIRSKGFDAYRNWKSNENGDQPHFVIRSRMSTSFTKDETALVFIDDIQVIHHDILGDFDMSIVDHIEISKHGVGNGIRGSGGIIKIYTDPTKINRLNLRTRHKAYTVPLGFSRPSKTFYKPIYSSYQTKFFKHYGVIDWFPKCKTDTNGLVKLKVVDTELNAIKLFIQGIASDGSFIYEESDIEIKN